MAERLKIYACSGIGAADGKYTYWLDNTQTVSNTQAVNTLLAIINEAYAEVTYLRDLTKEQKIALLNYIDWACVALDAAKRFKDDDTKLYHAGEVISVMLQDGLFEYDSLNNSERDAHLDALIEKASEMYGDETIKADDQAYMDDWKEQIVDLNKVGLSNKEQQTITKALSKIKVKGVSATDYNEIPDLAKYLNDAADYFLYTYFTEKQLDKLPRVFRTKAKQEWKIYEYCLALFEDTCGNKAAMDKIIRAKLIERYKALPEDVCAKIVSGEAISDAVALTVTEIIKIITEIVVPVVLAILTTIATVVAAKYSAKYKAIDEIAIDGGMPSPTDYKGSGAQIQNSAQQKNWLLWILGGAAVVALLKN